MWSSRRRSSRAVGGAAVGGAAVEGVAVGLEIERDRSIGLERGAVCLFADRLGWREGLGVCFPDDWVGEWGWVFVFRSIGLSKGDV